jgi:hypothetical protein
LSIKWQLTDLGFVLWWESGNFSSAYNQKPN